METQQIRKAILEKAKEEADLIIEEATRKSNAFIEKSRKNFERQKEEERKKIIAETEREAARITAQASLRARQIVLIGKDKIIASLINRAREELTAEPFDKENYAQLIEESIRAFESDEKINLFVPEKDMKEIMKVIDAREDLRNRVVEIRKGAFTGGVVIESENGKVTIDNSYEMRLEMLIPKILSNIGRILFGEKKR